jgi:hypothetical protein
MSDDCDDLAGLVSNIKINLMIPGKRPVKLRRSHGGYTDFPSGYLFPDYTIYILLTHFPEDKCIASNQTYRFRIMEIHDTLKWSVEFIHLLQRIFQIELFYPEDTTIKFYESDYKKLKAWKTTVLDTAVENNKHPELLIAYKRIQKTIERAFECYS